MKKKIISICLAVCMFFSFGFLFAGCGTVEAELNADEVYDIFAENFQNALRNLTIDADIDLSCETNVVVNGEIIDEESEYDSMNYSGVSLKIGNAGVSLSVPGLYEATLIGNQVYTNALGRGWSFSNADGFENSVIRQTIEELIETSTVKTALLDLKTYAQELDENAFTVAEQNGSKVVTIVLDYTNFVNAIIENIVTNKDEQLEIFINQLAEGISGNEFDIVGLLETVFGMFNDDTTVLDVIQAIDSRVDINLTNVAERVIEIFAASSTTKSKVISNYKYVAGVVDAAVFSEETENDILSTKIVDLIDGCDTLEEVLNLIKGYLRNDTITVSFLVNKVVGLINTLNGSEYTTEGVFQALESMEIEDFSILFNTTLNSSNVIENISISINANGNILDEQKLNGKTFEAGIELNFEISDIGTTVVSAPGSVQNCSILKKVTIEEFIGSNYVVDLSEYSFEIEDFEITVALKNGEGKFDTENPVVAVSYNHETCELTFNEDLYEIWSAVEIDGEQSNAILILNEERTVNITFVIN